MFRGLYDKKNIYSILALVLVMTIIWLFTQISGTVVPVIHAFFNSIRPLVLGMVLAFLLNPFVKQIADKYFKGKKIFGVLITIFVLITTLVFIIYPIVTDIMTHFSDIISYLQSATSMILDSVDAINVDLKNQILNHISSFGRTMTQFFLGSVNNVLNAFIQTFLTLIITVFALLEYDEMIIKLTKLFKKEKRTVVIDYFWGLEQQIHYYLRSLLISFGISSVVFGIVLSILKITNAWSFAFIMSLLIVLIPIIGPFIATGILAIITIPVSTTAIIFGLGGLFIFMQIFINIISPRIYAQTLNLSNLLIIASFMIGSSLLGIAGALFAIPALIVIVYTIRFLDKQYNWSERE